MTNKGNCYTSLHIFCNLAQQAELSTLNNKFVSANILATYLKKLNQMFQFHKLAFSVLLKNDRRKKG